MKLLGTKLLEKHLQYSHPFDVVAELYPMQRNSGISSLLSLMNRSTINLVHASTSANQTALNRPFGQSQDRHLDREGMS